MFILSLLDASDWDFKAGQLTHLRGSDKFSGKNKRNSIIKICGQKVIERQGAHFCSGRGSGLVFHSRAV